MKQIIHIISLIILLGACTDEKYSDTLLSGAGAPGKPVSVELVLHTQPMQSPLPTGTKAGSNSFSSTQVCKGMEISLTETPVTRATKEDEIVNFWVFQFNGTAPDSKLARKQFINGNSVKDVELLNLGATTKSKIVVIANASESAFNSLTIDATSLSDFNNMGILYNDNKTYYPLFSASVATPRVVFVGSADMVVAANKQADVMLYRSVARVKVNLSLSSDMQAKGYTNWGYQFMNIPEKSFYHSIGRTALFPGETIGYINYPSQSISLSTSPTSLDLFLPVNLQNPVPFTTPEQRVTNAPLKATFLQLVGMQLAAGGVITRSVVYKIHLGSNFTDDYSISPNYSYTYNIKITGESDDDSRVIKFIPGYFGGTLKTYSADGSETTNPTEEVTWRYEKRIEVYISDVNETGGIKWLNSGEGTMPGTGNSFMDGRQNTWDLQSGTQYPAIQRCLALNASTPQSIDAMTWYVPSFGQSISIYVAGSSTLKTLPNTFYWSSTTNGTNAWGTQVWTGQCTPESVGSSYNLRCVKDIDPNNTIN